MLITDYISDRQLASKKWKEVASTMATHIYGKPPKTLFINRRPLESQNSYALDYRLANFQPITRASFNTAISNIIEVANHIFVGELNVDERTENFISDFEIEIAGKTFDFDEFIIDFVGKQVEGDPNSAIVAYPVHNTTEFIPSYDAELPDFNDQINESVNLEIRTVPSKDIHYVTDKDILFYMGEWKVSDEKGESKYEPYFFHLNKDYTNVIYPVETADGIEYSIYQMYANELTSAPFRIIGHNVSFDVMDGEMIKFYESTYNGAVAIMNEVLVVKSDSGICDTRFTYPQTIVQFQACNNTACVTCVDEDSKFCGLKVNYTDDEDCSLCSTCNGTGKIAPDTTPLGSHIYVKADLFDDEGRFIPPITYITPPLQTTEYLDSKWRADFELGRKALFLLNQNMTNQSGVSKSYDIKEKVSTIKGAVNNIYAIKQKMMNVIQEFLQGDGNIEFIMPQDYNIRTSSDITEELKEAKDTTSVYKAELTKDLLLKKLGASAEVRKMVLFLEKIDKLFGYNQEQVVSAKAIYGNALTVRDQLIHDKGLAILQEIQRSFEDPADFLGLSDEELMERFDTILTTFLPVEVQNLTEPTSLLG